MPDRISKRCRLAFVVVSLVAGQAACDDDTDTDVVTVEDSGSLDISPKDTGLGIRVTFDRQCLSSSCDHVQLATCSASVTDNRIVVSSSLVYTSQIGGACTDDCGAASTECDVLVPTPGSYQLTHGACETTVTVPLPPFSRLRECDFR